MPSSNGHGPRTALLYTRVSTDEQARSGYSLAQQVEALRDHAGREGYEVLEEISDPGQSGASLERPGMDRVRDLVAAGGVSVVLAQDRDRFAREPAYHYLLKREFEEHGTAIRALNDRGDGSPEGELTDGILDQLAKFERAKIAERSRRGKMRKAREGKIVAGHTPNYGFRYNEARDGYEVDEENMRVVERIFRMVAEGMPLYAVKRALERDGVSTPPKPGGKPHSGAAGAGRASPTTWSKKSIRGMILEDAYRPHAYEEIAVLVSPEVAAQLDPERRYGVWWFNRRRTTHKTVAEAGRSGAGREYKKRQKTVEKPKAEWIAVPVPDSGVPREWVDAAREAIKDNVRTSSAGDRFWELSGGVLYCGGCGARMVANRVRQPRTKKPAHYYRCPTRQQYGKEACPEGRHLRADKVEPEVWGCVSALLTDPEQLRADLERMIELEREGRHGDPEREAASWAQKLADIERKREGYWDLAASGDMPKDLMRAKIAGLEDQRTMAERELKALRSHRERLAELERDKDALLDSYARMAPEALGALAPEERRQMYGMLRLRAVARPDGAIEVNGAFCADPEAKPVCQSAPSSR